MANHDDQRVRRDQANAGPDPRQAHSLVPMRTLDNLKIADGEPDIRGWSVFTSHGREIGEVQELLVDTTAMEVVMLDIDLGSDDRRTLAPIRAAWVDRTSRRVVIDAGEIEVDDDLPVLPRRSALTDSDVDEFDRRYARAYGRHGSAEHDYRLRYDEDEELRFARGAEVERERFRDVEPDADASAVERERLGLQREQERLARERAELEQARAELDEDRERILEAASETPDSPVEHRRYVERRRWSGDDTVLPAGDSPGYVRFPDSTHRARRQGSGESPPLDNP